MIPRSLDPSIPGESWQRWAWTLLAFSSAVYFLSDNTADNDLWGHLAFGRLNRALGHVATTDPFSFTVPGGRWVNHEWLGEMLFWEAYSRFGDIGLLVLKFLLVGLMFALLWYRLRRAAPLVPVASFCGVLALTVLARGCAIRPQLYTYVLIALVLVLLDRSDAGHRRGLALAPILTLLWVNLHGGVVAGVGIVVVYAAIRLLAAHSLRARWGPAAIAMLCVAATLGNPHGAGILASIGTPLVQFLPVGEWQPVQLTDPAQLPFVLLLLAAITVPVLTRRQPPPLWELALAALAAIVAVRQQRHTPLFALIAAPLVARQCSVLIANQRPALSASLQRLLSFAVVCLAVAQLALTAVHYAGTGAGIVFESRDYPVGAMAYLKHAKPGGHLALPLDWGSYAIWHLSPDWRVSIDGRLETVYPAAVIEQVFALVYGWPGWERFLAAYRTDAVLLPAGHDQHLRALGDWRPVYADAESVIYAPQHSTWPPVGSAPAAASHWLPFP